MIHDVEILESQLTFKDGDWILITDENKDVIGHKLNEQGYTWKSGNIIRKHTLKTARLLHIYKKYKYIRWSSVFGDKDVLNYNIIQIDI